ncbi:uncharacterized protein DUF3810 [Kineothrix alysoides]|uniref:Uncharacterized protein DUF3810 n=1 Tax=Kineothrix alysoides TaxID=1469948 RepID=A0A4R1QXX4_9FIRM|nr:DUF3810 domain-containing protein [Kineothrix alysoides]TCL57224.1 uncharacterized protein DUF3810 [Kineothrix alysoides]
MRRRGFLALLGIFALIAVANAIAWGSEAFCNFYVRNIFPLWVNTYGRFTGMFPFSVGEIMIAVGLVITVMAVVLGFVAVIFLLAFKRSLIYSRVMGFCRTYFIAYAWIFAGFCTVMTLNCFIPYHSSALTQRYGMLDRMSAQDPLLPDLLRREYTLEELENLRDYVVIRTNELAKQVNRDEEGNIIYPDNMEEIAIESMRNLSEYCEQLGGYYPIAKQFHFSGFFSQQKMKGYFFPFSMEANYNSLMLEINRPATICHEYAHLKGFMFEDEANLIGFLACANSSDVTFQYSGYLSILNYINNEYYEAIGRNSEIYASHVQISDQVKKENVFLKEAAWKRVEARALLDTEVVDKVSDKLSETSMVLNGVGDGILSYTRVVGLLLHYYDGSMEVQQTLADPGYLVQSDE